MSGSSDRALAMLATVLQMEEKGKHYYEKAAATTQNEVGREIWKLLAGYEVEHMERIRAIYGKLQGGAPWTEDMASFAVATDLGRVFRQLAEANRDKAKAGAGDVEALGVGVDFESASVNFYEENLAVAQDPLEKKFLELMVAEEREHLNLLSDLRYYYQDPAGWYMEKERSGLDGA
jgi:rubrerythrin